MAEFSFDQSRRQDLCAVSCGLEAVYMRKLAPARVSYRDDFLISYRVYMMTR